MYPKELTFKQKLIFTVIGLAIFAQLAACTRTTTATSNPSLLAGGTQTPGATENIPAPVNGLTNPETGKVWCPDGSDPINPGDTFDGRAVQYGVWYPFYILNPDGTLFIDHAVSGNSFAGAGPDDPRYADYQRLAKSFPAGGSTCLKDLTGE